MKIIAFVFTICLSFACFCLSFSYCFVRRISENLPELTKIRYYNPYQTSSVLDQTNELIYEFSTERRKLIRMKFLSRHVKVAFLAAEDARFHFHNGVDYVALCRAILYEIKYRTVGGRRVGGSTITQQVARIMFLKPEVTYKRKLTEILLAKKIERFFSKNQILNIYLNQIYFGSSSYGVEQAALTYYGVSASHLTLSQAACIASVPKNPNKVNPKRDLKRLYIRRNYVLLQMAKHRFVPRRDICFAISESVKSIPRYLPHFYKAPYYIHDLRFLIFRKFNRLILYKSGITVKASLSTPLQIIANGAFADGIRSLDKRQGYRGPIRPISSDNYISKWYSIRDITNKNIKVGDAVFGFIVKVSENELIVDIGALQGVLPISNARWARSFNLTRHTPQLSNFYTTFQINDIIMVRAEAVKPRLVLSLAQPPAVNGAFVAINPKNNHVLAMIGGYDFNLSNFNRATLAKRQSGSTIKPFIYALAFDSNIGTADTLISDRFIKYGNWRPRNSNNKHEGFVTLRKCLSKSINTCTIRLLDNVGIRNFNNLMLQLGEVPILKTLPGNLTLALGSREVVPLLHTNAFSIFANGGMYGLPVIVESILNRRGEVIFHANYESYRVVKPTSAYIVADILRDSIRPYAKKIGGLHAPLAGKTGTTNKCRSAWFVGFSHNIVAGVYIGFDNNKSLGNNEYGIKAAFPIWSEFMKKAILLFPLKKFSRPPGIVSRLTISNIERLISTHEFGDTGVTEFFKSTKNYEPEPLEDDRIRTEIFNANSI